MVECQCDECKNGCKYKPGWFLPGEVEAVAAFLKISLKELFRTKLSVDWWEGGSDGDINEDIFVLSPAVFNGNPGSEFDGDPEGTCVFFDDNNMCQIHKVKPHECREMMHTDSTEIIHARHKQVATSWQPYREQIVELLGREPVAEEYVSPNTQLLGWW